MAYKIYRHYQRSHRRRLLKTVMTLQAAQDHCSDPETSGFTCTSAEGKRRTRRSGYWFDSFYAVGG